MESWSSDLVKAAPAYIKWGGGVQDSLGSVAATSPSCEDSVGSLSSCGWPSSPGGSHPVAPHQYRETEFAPCTETDHRRVLGRFSLNH